MDVGFFLLKIIITFLIIVIITGIIWILYNQVNKIIDKKETELKKMFVDSNIKINSELSIVNSNIENKVPLTTYKSYLDEVKDKFSLLDTMNLTINDLKSNVPIISSNMSILDDRFNTFSSNFTTLSGSFQSFKDEVSPQMNFFGDLINLDSRNLKFGVGSNIDFVTINKPLNLEELKLSSWTIKEEPAVHSLMGGDTKLCFKKAGRKVLCINNGATPLELFDTYGNTHSNFDTREYFIRGPP